jgi:CubicO group peptidase (beta-lactamase class C family)
MRGMFLGRSLCASLVVAMLMAGVGRTQELGPMAKVLQPLVEAHTLAGAVVLVATPEEVLDVEAIGYADIESQRPMQTNELFWIASMTKPMTAVALMMLVDEGKVALDDPVEKYLPAFHDMKVAVATQERTVLEPASHPITIRECLWHGAGLPFSSALEHPTQDALPLAERVESYAQEPLLRQPGTLSVYSNEGPNIVGRIIEVVGGRPYEEFLQQRLLVPLGMTDTTFIPSEDQIARLATVYKTSPDTPGLVPSRVSILTYPLDGPGRYPLPAGGLFSTAHDVALFCRMMANHGVWEGHRYLSEKSWAEMKTRQTPPGDKADLGLIWRLGPDTISHSGADKTNMRIDLAKRFITVFLVQQDGAWPNGAKDVDEVFEEEAERMFLPYAAAKAADKR